MKLKPAGDHGPSGPGGPERRIPSAPRPLAARLREAFTFNRVIAANIKVKAASEIVVKAGRLVLIVAATRSLGPERFGVYSFAFAFSSIFINLADFGLHLRLSREVARGEQAPGRPLGEAVRAKALLSVAVALALVIASWVYPRPIAVRLVLLLSGAWLLAQSWCDFWNYYFRGLQSLREEAALNLVNMALSTILGIGALVLHRGVPGLFGALLLSALATNALALVLLRRRGHWPQSATASAAWAALRDASPIGLAILFATIYFRIDILFLERMRGDTVVGNYGAAYRLLESLVFLPALFLAALYPALAETARADLAELRRLMRAGLRWMALLASTIVLAIVLLAPLGLRILYGTRYDDAVPILRLLAPSLLFLFPSYVLTHLLVATQGQKWNAILGAVGVAVNVGLNFPAVSRFGAEGAAAATGVTEAVLFTLGWIVVRYRLARMEPETVRDRQPARPESQGRPRDLTRHPARHAPPPAGIPWIILLTWQARDRLAISLSSLRELRGDFEVLVVDNGSTDGTIERAREILPRAHILGQTANLGFAEGNNRGIAHALERDASHVLLLNDDMKLDPGWLEAMLRDEEACPEAGIRGGLVLFLDRPDTINSSGIVADAFYRARDRDFGLPRSRLRATSPENLSAVTGGAMLIARRVLERVGGFDPRLFAWYEDYDLCLRARRAGFAVRFVPEAVSYHRFAGSLSAAHPLRAYYLGRNQLWMVGRHAPLWNAVPLLLAGAAYRALVKAPFLALRAQPELGAAETRAALHGLAAGAGEIVWRLRHGSSPFVPDPGR